MDLSYGSAADQFRQRVQAFLTTAWQPGERRGDELTHYVKGFRRTATEAGFLYRGIPKRYGGSEQLADVVCGQVIREVFAAARAPLEVGGNGVHMLIPTLLERGTEEQRERFIRPTLEGDFIWAQGYSEPGAGSDLASVRTRAYLKDDHWIIKGQKTWTTQGREATHMFALVRTDPDAPKHAGVSYLLIDLNQPGITRRPIRQMTGGSGFYEFFLEDVKTPASWIVGERGGGWQVSRTTLKHERASIGSSEVLGGQFEKLIELARHTPRGGGDAVRDPEIRQALARIEGWVMAHRYTSYRLFSCAAAGEDLGHVSLMMKLLTTEIGHEMALLAQELIGNAALIEPAPAGSSGRGPEKWLDQIMGSVGNSIAGGTTNIQRNIIGERGLGLPRDSPMGDCS